GSNSQRKVIELLLTRTKLAHYFDEYVGVDEVSSGKPSPEIYLKALEKAEANPHETLVLDDSVNGVKAAHEAGIPAIMVPDLEQPDEEAKKITLKILSDLNEVHQYIEKNIIKK